MVYFFYCEKTLNNQTVYVTSKKNRVLAAPFLLLQFNNSKMIKEMSLFEISFLVQKIGENNCYLGHHFKFLASQSISHAQRVHEDMLIPYRLLCRS